MIRRFSRMIGIRPEAIDEYKKLHAEIWPEIALATRRAGLCNYSIHLCELPCGNAYLFSYFEYDGADFDADIATLDDCPQMNEWNACCEACQVPLGIGGQTSGWSDMEEVFYQQ